MAKDFEEACKELGASFIPGESAAGLAQDFYEVGYEKGYEDAMRDMQVISDHG